jgi:ribosomal protein S6
MRRYEVVFVLAPTLTEEEFDQQVESYSQVAREMGAEIVEVDKWGKRRLAFPVEKHNEGYYTVLTIDEPAGKAVAVRVDLDQKRAEKFEQRREARRQRKGKDLPPELSGEAAETSEQE